MISKLLIGLGLTIIPFFSLPGYDTRIPKMGLALVLALALSLWVIYKGQLKEFKNKWILIFLGFLLINIYLSPKPYIVMSDILVQNFWVWQSTAYILIFAFMLISVASVEFGKNDVLLLLKVMVWCGFIMAIYCLLQALCLDQFFVGKGFNSNVPFVVGQIGGTLGNCTIVSPFLAMIIPLALYLKKYWFAVIIALAVILTFSQIGIGGMVVSLMFYFGVKSRRNFIIILGIISIILFSYSIFPGVRALVRDSGRFGVWAQIVKDMVFPAYGIKYPITGIGIGSFGYTYHKIHNTAGEAFLQAHNEYLELFWNVGLVGLSIFLCAMFYVWLKNFSFKAVIQNTTNEYRMALLSSFLCVSVCAGGTFVWQIGPIIFYTLVIVGLLTNRGGEI